MKRIPAMILSFVLLIVALTGCKESQNSSENEDELPKNSPYLIEENGAYILKLPQSGDEIKLQNEQILFVPYITDELVETAETKIKEAVSSYSNSSDFYLQINDGYLCLVAEVIKQLEPPSSQETEGEFAVGGCGIDHKHLFFSERISTQALEIGSSENPQKFKLSITGEYADNMVNELEDSYLSGEKIIIQLQTVTEHYYIVTVNGTAIPQTDSDLEYTWFSFKMVISLNNIF